MFLFNILTKKNSKAYISYDSTISFFFNQINCHRPVHNNNDTTKETIYPCKYM